MTRLTVFDEAGSTMAATEDADAIAQALADIGVRFERWPAGEQEARAEALRAQGYTTVDTVSVTPDHPDREAMRARFLSEHRHAQDEVRYFVEGSGLFTLPEGGRVPRLEPA